MILLFINLMSINSLAFLLYNSNTLSPTFIPFYSSHLPAFTDLVSFIDSCFICFELFIYFRICISSYPFSLTFSTDVCHLTLSLLFFSPFFVKKIEIAEGWWSSKQTKTFLRRPWKLFPFWVLH